MNNITFIIIMLTQPIQILERLLVQKPNNPVLTKYDVQVHCGRKNEKQITKTKKNPSKLLFQAIFF